jgi:predicted RNA binding protein YcfA (HicA-like mRNA interferase family)
VASTAILIDFRGLGRRWGSHAILHHESRPGRVVVPVHSGRILKPKTLLSILDQAGISIEQLGGLL